MCEICVEMSKFIEETFGHVVQPDRLARFIESCPVKCPDCGCVVNVGVE